MRAVLVAVTTALTLGLAGVPAASAEATPSAAAASFDVWFNGNGYSPKADLAAGAHSVSLRADCDSDVVAGQLYHVTWGRDRKVGNVVRIPCGGSAHPLYQLSGGEYYFYFLSGVDNTRVVGTWA
ncbi:hypothetical protein [Streptomyces roseoviridis]|uniref:Secreted protein n=1 Tax=Streptomyces roseoviridis TaxID=67361 RepID=A0ABV5QRR6_9ACTN